MNVTTNGGIFRVRAPFALRDALAALPARRWNAADSCWETPATGACARALQEIAAGDLDADEAFRAFLSWGPPPWTIEWPSGLTPPMPHQLRALRKIDQRDCHYLAWEMGAGKTLPVIAWIAHARPKSVLIVAPKSVLPVWAEQFRRHWPGKEAAPYQPLILDDSQGTVRERTQVAHLHRGHVVAVNYDVVFREPLASWIAGCEWHLVVTDEAHRLADPRGRTSKFFAALLARARKRVCLSGTPWGGAPEKIYAQMRWLDPGVFGTSFTRFRARYCIMGGWKQKNIVAYRDLDDLRRRFGEVSDSVRIDDVADLPDAHHVDIACPLGPRAARLYRDLEDSFVVRLQAGEITLKNALVELSKLSQCTGGGVLRDDGGVEDLGDEKESALRDLLADLGPEPAVVFAEFRDHLRRARRAAEAAGRPVFELSGERKELDVWSAACRAERAAGAPLRGPVLVVQTASGGLGVSMVEARYAVWYSETFSLVEYEQALARLRRIGQQRVVTYYHLVAPGTVDERIRAALAKKQEVTRALVEGTWTKGGR